MDFRGEPRPPHGRRGTPDFWPGPFPDHWAGTPGMNFPSEPRPPRPMHVIHEPTPWGPGFPQGPVSPHDFANNHPGEQDPTWMLKAQLIAHAAEQPGHLLNMEARRNRLHPEELVSVILYDIQNGEQMGMPSPWLPFLEVLPGWLELDQGGGDRNQGGESRDRRGEGHPPGEFGTGRGDPFVEPEDVHVGQRGSQPDLARRQQQIRERRRREAQRANASLKANAMGVIRGRF